MEESLRLECPACGLSYRVKQPVPGKTYNCRKCGSGLRPDGGGGQPLPREAPDRSEAGGFAANPTIAPIPGPGKEDLQALADRLAEIADALSGELKSGLDSLDASLAGRLEAVLDRTDAAAVRELAENLSETRKLILERLDSGGEETRTVLAGLTEAGRALEASANSLANRMGKELRERLPRFDDESGSVIDALARLADELVKEQNSNTSRLDRLADEIRAATSGIANLGEWRAELPVKVADEIGRTVEDRMIGPISGALIRQAPGILSGLQDNRLVDVVSRAVREAQRPLLREILAGGRVGVPVWLFAAVLLPLLLILGYLFLPGELGTGAEAPALARAGESLLRLEANGAPLPPEADARLRNIEDAVLDLHGQALAHARNSSALEEQVKNLNSRLAEKEMLINEYNDTLQRQVRLLNAYRARLNQLGVSPDTLPE